MKLKIKQNLRRYSPALMGKVDYFFDPQRNPYGGAFNDQKKRQELVDSILKTLPIKFIVETGTFMGTTSEFLSRYQIPLLTVEQDPYRFQYSRNRLRKSPWVQGFRTESSSFLEKKLQNWTDQIGFFYLDAHQDKKQSPIRREIQIIADRFSEFVIMIDDFQHDQDKGYGHDFYSGNALGMDLIQDILEKNQILAFYPNCRSQDETGHRRGCIVLTRGKLLLEKLQQNHELRQAQINSSGLTYDS